MAASMSTMFCSARKLSLKCSLLHRISFYSLSHNRFSSDKPDELFVEDFSVSDEMDQDEIDRIRNVSGLTEKQRQKMTHARAMPNIEYEFQKTVKYQRKMYAQFGKSSSVDPRIMWPSLEELNEMKTEENEWEPTLQEMWENIEEKNTAREQAAKKREAQVEKNMSEMGKWIQQYYDKLAAKEEEKRKQLEKKQKLLEEAREYFGYDVDPKDAKFQQMLEEKELQRKRESKAKKKLQAAAKLATQLRMMAESASEASASDASASDASASDASASDASASDASASDASAATPVSDSSTPLQTSDPKVDNSSLKTTRHDVSAKSEDNSQQDQR